MIYNQWNLTKQLSKGQTTNLQKNAKNSIKFKKIKHLAIYIESNQNDTEKTYLNGIIFNGTSPKKNAPKPMDDDVFAEYLMDKLKNDFKQQYSKRLIAINVAFLDWLTLILCQFIF